MIPPAATVDRFFALTDVKGREVSDLLPALRDLLTEDFVFMGPLMRTEGREQYLGLLGQFLPAHVGYRFHHRFVDGNEVCSVYDMDVRTPSGATLTLSMADWLAVRAGRICRQKLFYDPRGFAEAFGMK
jgi:ketosteroid isomerase-like protein